MEFRKACYVNIVLIVCAAGIIGQLAQGVLHLVDVVLDEIVILVIFFDILVIIRVLETESMLLQSVSCLIRQK